MTAACGSPLACRRSASDGSGSADQADVSGSSPKWIRGAWHGSLTRRVNRAGPVFETDQFSTSAVKSVVAMAVSDRCGDLRLPYGSREAALGSSMR